jgi:hypothetical protein
MVPLASTSLSISKFYVHLHSLWYSIEPPKKLVQRTCQTPIHLMIIGAPDGASVGASTEEAATSTGRRSRLLEARAMIYCDADMFGSVLPSFGRPSLPGTGGRHGDAIMHLCAEFTCPITDTLVPSTVAARNPSKVDARGRGQFPRADFSVLMLDMSNSELHFGSFHRRVL